MSQETRTEKGTLSINSENLFPIIKKWLYSDQDIFIRELVSNAVDAIRKRKRLVSLGEAEVFDGEYRVTVSLHPDEKTVVISDNGIGMTADEVKKYINQIAFSGAKEFLEKYKDNAEDTIIGHFGLGFYSAFMVAETVEIETLSCLNGAEPVHWSCDGSSSFEMTPGTRETAGTDIILRLNEDGEKYLTKYEMQDILEKYCAFMAVPIFLEDVSEKAESAAEDKEAADAEDKEVSPDDTAAAVEAASEDKPAPTPVNDTEPLWLKNPNDCTEEEYKAFYTKVFRDFKEPLFWIHLNMDYPFNLKGILYFPKLGNEFEYSEGQVKLFSNQVFVADNVKEIIPEFLLLLKGAIDCPDIPLNVSRSFLQNDGTVKKISEYITKKVADKLTSLFGTERENYEHYWDDIHPFIKFGCLRNEKFYDRLKDCLIFKSVLTDRYLTLGEYLEAAKEKHENKVFYATDTLQQAAYIKIAKENELDTVVLGTGIDNAFISLLESKQEGVKFIRVDADIRALTASGKEETPDSVKENQERLQKLFADTVGKPNLKLRLEALGSPRISALIELSEESRRFADMMKLYGNMGFMGSLPDPEEILVVNSTNPLVRHLLVLPESAEPDEKDLRLIRQLYSLARLSYTNLSADELNEFIERSQEILEETL